jgi:predicted acyl esterase
MVFWALLCLAVVSNAQIDPDLELMLPMRDGIKLHTAVNFPVDRTPPYGTVIDRSPYGENRTEQLADLYLTLGFAAVRQDMRGTKQSEGNFTLWRTEDDDYFDTMKWIEAQDWSDGRVWTIGGSADGMASFQVMYEPPPQLEAQFFIWSTSTGYPIAYPGGAFRQALIYFWMHKTVPKEAQKFIDLLKTKNSPGEWWNPLNGTGHYSNVTWPSVHYAGWYDIFLIGHLAAFEGFQKLSDPSVRGKHKLVIDPCGHCQDAGDMFMKKTNMGRTALAIEQSFDLFTGEHKYAQNVSAITWYLMSSEDAPDPLGNYWVTADDWPVFTPTLYYLQSDMTLTPQAPVTTDGDTSFIYDPTNPCPTNGGSNLEIACGPLDQAEVEARSDNIVFTTPVLTDPLPLTGPLWAHLFVSSNCTDTDFTVKITDVYPDGESIILQDGIVRMAWRDYEGPHLITPGNMYAVDISLWNTSYVFIPGHKLRIAVSSSNYPRFNANPNNGLPITVNGTALIAQNTVYHNANYASYITLPVVRMDQLPEVILHDNSEHAHKLTRIIANQARAATAAAAL